MTIIAKMATIFRAHCIISSNYTVAMEQSNGNAGLYVRFLNLVRALDDSSAFPPLDATEERLLKQLAAAWSANKPVSVLETMDLESDVSPTTIHRRLKSLKNKGVITLEVDPADNRVKYVHPTALTTEYFAKLSNCLLAAAK